MRTVLKTYAVVLSALLVGCGGGSDNAPDAGEKIVPRPTSFISWVGNANGEVVMDTSGEAFKVTTGDRCVYVVASDYLITNYCGLPGGQASQLVFAGMPVVVRGVRLIDGRCVAGFVDVATGHGIDISRLPSGQFIGNVVTGWVPIPC